MALELQGISRVVGGKVHIHPTDLTLQKGTMNVLLGPTLSGKTSLMRLMAGLDAPTQGTIRWNGADVTGQRVQDRGVAMVYQQFINYPGLSVYENIASPLRVAGRPASEIDAKVRETAELMRLTPMLGRKPRELGGQQQRCALARALVKGAGWSFWTNRWPTWPTSCAKSCGFASRASSRQAGRSSSMPRQSRRRRCFLAATPRPCGKAASPSSGRHRRSIVSPTTW